MIKFLFLLFLGIILSGIIALRFRRQILAAVEIWEHFKNPELKDKNRSQIDNKSADSISLIKCSKCTVWIPQNKAIRFNSKIFFCSQECAEKVSEIS